MYFSGVKIPHIKCAESFWYHRNLWVKMWNIVNDFMDRNAIFRVRQGKECTFLEMCSQKLGKPQFLEIDGNEKFPNDMASLNSFLFFCVWVRFNFGLQHLRSNILVSILLCITFLFVSLQKWSIVRKHGKGLVSCCWSHGHF